MASGRLQAGAEVANIDEAARLERLWNGEFGDQYVSRNTAAGGGRGPFWAWHAARFPAARLLEIGCNIGANLRHLVDHADTNGVWGVDVNEVALTQGRQALPSVNFGWAAARELPFRDRFFDLTLSVAVLIHQPSETIGDTIDELVRCSRRFVTVIEYTAPEVVEVTYRGQVGAFFKRPFGDVIAARHPELELTHRQDVTKGDGFDDGMECFVFSKP